MESQSGVDGSSKGKQESSSQGAVLAIFVSQDTNAKQTQVFFTRIEVKDIPTKPAK